MGLIALALLVVAVSNLHMAHGTYQSRIDYATSLLKQARALELSLSQQRLAETAFVARPSDNLLLLRENHARRAKMIAETLSQSLVFEDKKRQGVLKAFQIVSQRAEDRFQLLVNAQRQIALGNEGGSEASFNAARDDFRKVYLLPANAEFAGPAETILDAANDYLAKRLSPDLLRFSQTIDKLENLMARSPRQDAALLSARRSLHELADAFQSLVASYDRFDAYGKILTSVVEDERKQLETLIALLETENAEASAAMEVSLRNASLHLWLTIIGGLGAVIGVTVWIRDTVSVPLHEMAVAMGRLSNGELDVTISRCRRRDELGRLSHSFFKFQRKLKESVALSRRLEEKQRALLDRQAILDLVMSAIPLGLVVHDRNDVILSCSARFSTSLQMLLGRDPIGMKADEIWSRLKDVGHIDHPPHHRAENGEIIRTTMFKLKDGRSFQIFRQAAQEGCWVSTTQDVTERVRQDEHIAHMAMYDSLTDLPNRAHFTSSLETALNRRTGDERVTVFFFDLDRFKQVNDTFGHAVGDALLVEVAQRLRKALSSRAFIARLGGDEFAVFIAEPHDDDDASRLAKRIIEAVSEPYSINRATQVVGCSLGVAVAPRDASSLSDLLIRADLALYRSKQQGRGVYHFFCPDMMVEHEAVLVQERELRNALVHDQFEVWYQPIYRVCDLKMVACEALLRWRHPTRGFVNPADFIPVAERSGLISPIGGWVLKKACADAALWPTDLKVCVNVSVVQLRSAHLVSNIKAALAASGLPARRLEVEITESRTLSDIPAVVQRLDEIRALGISLAMDDFGTAHSVMSSLEKFPFDKIKLDKTYIQGPSSGSKTASAIMRAVAVMAQDLNLESVGEGVETPEQLAMMKAMGFSLAQGFLLARPMPQRDFLARYRDLETRFIPGTEAEAFAQALVSEVAA